MNWVLYRSACYLRGRGVSFGTPLVPPQETNPATYSVSMDVVQNGRTAVMDRSWDIFAQESLDHIYIGPRLETIDTQEEFLREGVRKLKLGSHLIVHTQVKTQEEPGVFPLQPELVDKLVGKVGRWQKKGEWVQDGVCLQIYKRLKGTQGVLPVVVRSGRRACVCRFGALGDAIILTPLLHKLSEDGYEVTFVGTPYCAPALENNPYISNLLLQERDVVPNQELGQYWRLWEKEYDKYINLSESIEGDLLIVEGRKEFYTSQTWRHKRCNSNYYDYSLERAGYSGVEGSKGELYFTEAEERRARGFFDSLRGKFVILWALNGSSHHKVYPMMEAVLRKWLDEHPSSVGVTVGDHMARLLEFEHPQLIERAGKWSIRESLIATKYASLVIGPETMITNAAGCFPTPKITILSHSSHENLCRWWENDYCIEPDKELAPCYPCHQLHYTKESCPLGVIEDTSNGKEIARAPLCSVAVLPTKLFSRIEEVYNKFYKKD